ncbi:MAG: hypothetical protein ACRCX4_07460 [Bacteroidales bacterium]
MATKQEIREAKRKGITFEDARQNPEFIESARRQQSQTKTNPKAKSLRKTSGKKANSNTKRY